jgi:hypothetical protein
MGAYGIPQYPVPQWPSQAWNPGRAPATAAQIEAGLRYLAARYGPGDGQELPLPDPDGFPVVAGAVYGYRWWSLPAPDWRRDPGDAERHWPHGLLHGVNQGEWQPGVNTASCTPGSYRPGLVPDRGHPAPVPGCGCGFWAYWQPRQHELGGPGTVPVFGVIKAWGRVRPAQYGFRAEKARILAVHLPFTLRPDVYRPGWHGLRGPGREPSSLTPAQAGHAEAWIATVGDRLAADYGAAVFETRNALLACYPPDPVYGSRGLQPGLSRW